LKVGKNAHDLILRVYRVTKNFPSDERFGLTSQIRRSSSSSGANIAEGCGREGSRELARFLLIASGSVSELGYHLKLAKDLEYLPEDKYSQMAAEVVQLHKMIAALIAKVAMPQRSNTVK
jgi:four helix bundle protein